jgi:amino acid adenylation domain-containing protein/non-ribosomal peptide synthase protein (TIGR01720 family)
MSSATPISRPQAYAASYGQRRLWMLDRLDPGGSAYLVPSAIEIAGDIDPRRLGVALNAVIARHESLRTTFAAPRTSLNQVVHPALAIDLPMHDVSSAPEADAAARSQMAIEAGRPFDLQQGPLIRAGLWRLAHHRFVLLIVVHHIVIDEWSLGVLMRDLFSAYASGTSLEPLTVQYKDYTAWLEQQVNAADADRAFWREQLSGERPALTLPIARPRPAELTHDGARSSVHLDESVWASLRGLNRDRAVTPFMTASAIVFALLHRYTGEGDFILGTPVAGRDHPELESQIGFFVNMLPLRARFTGRESFAELLRIVHATATAAYAHAGYPFDRLVNELEMDRDLGRSPVFDMVVAWEQAIGATPVADGVTLAPFELGLQAAKYDLSFYFREDAGLTLTFNYNTRLFDRESIERLGRHFVNLATAAAAEPNREIGSLAMVAGSERQELLVTRNATGAGYPADATIVSLIGAQVRQHGSREAVRDSGGAFTYDELWRVSAGVAARITEAGATAGGRVAVVGRPGRWMPAALLGVLRTGAAYVPLDPEYPLERLAFMIDDSGVDILLTDEDSADIAGELRTRHGTLRVLRFDSADAASFSATGAAEPDAAAYVIYTSGSTGRPKGCLISHRNVVRLLRNDRMPFDFGLDDVWVVAHSFCFDFSVWELYGALTYGGRVVIPARDTVRDPGEFLALLSREGVTVLNQTPAAFLNLVRREAREPQPVLATHLRYVIFGGDRLSPADLRGWAARYPLDRVALVNMFGITETTVHVTYCRLTGADLGADHAVSPIGRPLPETRVYVLNSAGEPQPDRVPGEMFVGGTGVGLGYLNRPELTRERFIANPFVDGDRLYRTGDLAAWNPDGTLWYLGRNDDQVQVRGFRIELQEIEQQLSAHGGVDRGAVIARTTDEGHVEVIAYAVVTSNTTADALREHLAGRLPAHMVPAHIVLLDAVPLTSNGKIDRRALPAPAVVLSRDPGREMPRTRLEQALAATWSRVLGVAAIGRDDNYFALGGDSMKVIRLLNTIAADLGVRLDVKDVFRHPTVALLARAILVRERSAVDEDGLDEAYRAIDALKASILADPAQKSRLPAEWVDFYPMSDIEQGMVFHSVLDPSVAMYHDQFVYQWRDPDGFDEATFRDAIAQVAERHDSLRASYHLTGFDEPIRVVHRSARFDWAVEDLCALDPLSQRSRIVDAMDADRRVPFDVTVPSLWRLRLFRLSANEVSVLWIFHHAILDGWSNATLMTELAGAYFAIREVRPSQPAPLRSTYRDFVADQRRWPTREATRSYWTALLENRDRMPLPFGAAARAGDRGRRATFSQTIDRTVATRLRQLAQNEGAPTRAVFLAAFLRTLALATGRRDVTCGLVTHGRPAIDDGDLLVGCFLNSVPFRRRLAAAETPRAQLRAVHQQLQELKAHERLSMRAIAELAGATADQPLFDILFNFIDFHVLTSLAGDDRVNPGIVAPFEQTDTPLDFSVNATFDDFRFTVYYDDGIFTGRAIERLVAAWERALRRFADAPDQPLINDNLLDQDERQWLDQVAAGAVNTYERDASIVELFNAQVDATPDADAVSFGYITLSYRELQGRAHALAHWLRDRGLQSEEPVAVLMDRSEHVIAAVAGVLIGGGAYVPIDPAFPDERVRFMLHDAGIRFAIVTGTQGDRLPAGIEAVDASSLGATGRGAPAVHPCGPESLAYICYTSGSTGTPKGALIEHRNVVRLVRQSDYVDFAGFDKPLRILQGGSLAFDASTFEIWGALLNGGCVCLPAAGTLLDPDAYRRALAESRVNVLFITTSLFNQFVGADVSMFSGLDVLLTGGERVSVEHINRARVALPHVRIEHVYGPTENTTFSTWYHVTTDHVDDVPIGRPIANSTAYLLDPCDERVPSGVPGEICTGGDGVARGYLNADRAGAARFAADPFRSGRMYRTGDVGEWLPDGSIRFIGRIDDQVKIRGFRVEPGEVEQHIRRHPAVREAIVVVRRLSSSSAELIAYITAAPGFDTDALRAYLAAALPSYMVPAHLVQLPSLPVRVTGKVDRQALPAPEDVLQASAESFASEHESVLADAWKRILGRPSIARRDNYFSIGGDSIRAIQVVGALKQSGWKLDIADLFAAQTLERTAARLRRDVAGPALDDGIGPAPLLPAQRWFFEEHQGDLHHFNLSMLLASRERIDAGALRQSVLALWQHHDALRATFPGAHPSEQVIHDRNVPLRFDVHDLRDGRDADAAFASLAEQVQSGFDLVNGPLFAAALFQMPDGDRVLLAAHHLVIDVVSWHILLGDLEHAYLQATNGAAPILASRTDSVRRCAASLAGRTAAPSGHTASQRERSTYGECESVTIAIGEVDTQRIASQAHSAYNTTTLDLLLTALGRAWNEPRRSDSLPITLERHGRDLLDPTINTTRTVGWFTDLLPHIVTTSGDAIAADLQSVKDSLRREFAAATGRFRTAPTAMPLIAVNFLGVLDAGTAAATRQFRLLDTPAGRPISPNVTRAHPFDLVAAIVGGQLTIALVFTPARLDRAGAETFLARYRDELLAITAHCCAQDGAQKTAGDFVGRGVADDDLTELLGQLE